MAKEKKVSKKDIKADLRSGNPAKRGAVVDQYKKIAKDSKADASNSADQNVSSDGSSLKSVKLSANGL
ncbi:MAG: hypothetical protein LBM13_05535, partial [Candidatus Ancillula sp.]|nr:hypothetical protein [Candidatus Ancillula sp.]